MISSILHISLFMFTLNVGLESKSFKEDYCWRDYEGIIPSDALEGGLDRNGNPIYIGQTLFENKLIPGKIYLNQPKIYYEWYSEEYSTIDNIKILCSEQPQKFEWIQTDSKSVINLTNKIFLNGGYEKDYSTYIGRALTEGETSVGKVVCETDNCLGLYTSINGRIKEHKQFQILTYNPTIKDIDPCKPVIDVRLRSL